MKIAPTKNEGNDINPKGLKKVPINSVEEFKKISEKAAHKGMGEHSKKMLNELIPLIQLCKKKDNIQSSNKDHVVAHKKSFSIAPNLELAHGNTKTPDKTVIHLHKKSAVPNIIKLECPTFDAIMEKADKVQVNPVSKTVMINKKETRPSSTVAEKPAHRRTKSDCPNADAKKIQIEKQSNVNIKGPIKKNIDTKIINKKLLPSKDTNSDDNNKIKPCHRRTRSDQIPAIKKAALDKSKEAQAPGKEYFSIAQKGKIQKPHPASKQPNVKQGSVHERSISTQIKINTFLHENGGDSHSKVISITQNTKIAPSSKFDVDIVNIAIKRKETNSKGKMSEQPSKQSKDEASTNYSSSDKTPTKLVSYKNLSKNTKKQEEEAVKMGGKEGPKNQKQVNKTEVHSKGNSKIQTPEVEENQYFKLSKMNNNNNKNKKPIIKGPIAISLAKKAPVQKLSVENIEKMEHDKDIAALTERIKTRINTTYLNINRFC